MHCFRWFFCVAVSSQEFLENLASEAVTTGGGINIEIRVNMGSAVVVAQESKIDAFA